MQISFHIQNVRSSLSCLIIFISFERSLKQKYSDHEVNLFLDFIVFEATYTMYKTSRILFFHTFCFTDVINFLIYGVIKVYTYYHVILFFRKNLVNSLCNIKNAAFPVFLQFLHWFPQQMEFGSVVLPMLASRLSSHNDFIHLWELLSIIKKRNWNSWSCCSSAVFKVKVLPLLTFCRCVSTHSSGFCRFNLFFPTLLLLLCSKV